MPTPVSDGKLLYVVSDTGVVFALDVKTGATVYGPERLPPGTYSASPILADGKIYVTTEEEGLTTVFRAGPKFEILASNSLLERLLAVLPQHGRRVRGPAVHPHLVVPVGDWRSEDQPRRGDESVVGSWCRRLAEVQHPSARTDR